MDREIGYRHSRWTVIGPKIRKGKRSYYPCKCDCGTLRDVRADQLDSNHQSCGCHRVDTQRARRTKHGHTTVNSHSETYSVWQGIIARCYNPRLRAFKDYGERGITVCTEWRDFRNFLRDMGERPSGMTIDRINSDLGYNKENCKWSSRGQQSRNYSKKSVYYEFMGFSFIQKDWARIFGVPLARFRIWKIDFGFSMEEIATKALLRGTWDGKIDFSYLKFYNQYENYVPTPEEVDRTWSIQEKYLTPHRGRKRH